MERILGEFQKKYDLEIEIINIRASKENMARSREYKKFRRTPYLVFFNAKGKNVWEQTGIMYENDILDMFKRYSVKIKEKGAS